MSTSIENKPENQTTQPLRTRPDYGSRTAVSDDPEYDEYLREHDRVRIPHGLKKGDTIEIDFYDRADAEPRHKYRTYKVLAIRGRNIEALDWNTGKKVTLDIDDYDVSGIEKVAGAQAMLITAEEFEDAFKESKFEKGKPADPTENMSPEDAAEWKKQNKEHADEFKTAASDRLVRFTEGVMTEKEWVQQNAGRVEEFYYKDWHSLIDKKKWNRMDNDEQREYEAKLKKKIEKPEFRAYRKSDDSVFVTISKDTYLWAKREGIGKTAAGRSLDEIAEEIRSDWKNVYFGAVPYLDAMESLNSINDNYGSDSGSSIVAYFLSNATSWRGPVAKRIKAELNSMLKSSKRAAFDTERVFAQVRRKLALDVIARLKGLSRLADQGVWTEEHGKLEQNFKIPGIVNEAIVSAQEAMDDLIDLENWSSWNKTASSKIAVGLPKDVERYVKEIQKKSPSYTEAQTWATAWSIYCRSNPDSDHCHQDSYFKKSALSTADYVADIYEAKFEKGKPADPTENMSPEDAAEWKKQNKEHADEFKSASMQSKVTEAIRSYYEDQMSEPLKKTLSRALFDLYEGPGIPDEEDDGWTYEKALRELSRWWQSVGQTLYFDTQSEMVETELPKGFQDGDEWVEPMLEDYIEVSERDGAKAIFGALVTDGGMRLGSESDSISVADYEDAFKESKFEKGKPADPTENMSEEDAAEWKRQNKEHADEFKSANGTKTASNGNYFYDGKDYYVDTAFMNSIGKALPGFEMEHMGFGEFTLKGPEGEIEFDRMRGKDFSGQSGRSHKLYDNKGGKLVEKLIAAMKHKATEVTEGIDKTAEWKEWTEDMPVQVATDHGTEVFENLAEAKRKYRTLDPRKNTNDFTWAMHGEVKGKPAIRFESWGVYERLSRGASLKTSAKENFVFLIETSDGFKVAHSVHEDPKAGFQTLKDGMDEGEATRLAKKMADKWGTTVLEFKASGDGSSVKYTKTAASGLYGFTKEAERVCGSATNKLSKFATKLAKDIYEKDAETPAFLEEHTKRTGSKSARMLRGCMAEIGPGQPAKTAASVSPEATKTFQVEILPTLSEFTADRWVKQIEGFERASINSTLPDHGVAHDLSKHVRGNVHMPTFFKQLVGLINQWESGRKTAAKGNKGRYGFSTKTAKLALGACHEVEHEAGVIASDLHSRMGTKYATITGFLSKHAKRAKCGWSDLILEAYPTQEQQVIASKTASDDSIQPSVDEILAWEGQGRTREAASFLASEKDEDEDEDEETSDKPSEEASTGCG
jgi:hypothetical protein